VLVGKSLEKILSLPDDALRGFVAGVLDSDGCISIKRGKKKDREYKVAHVEFLISKNSEINLNFILALRRLDVYSKLVETDKNVDIIRITGREDVFSLQRAIRNYSVKMNIKIPERIHKVSSSSNRLPKFVVANICNKILKHTNKVVLNKTDLKTIYPYRNFSYRPSRDGMKEVLNKIGRNLNPEIRKEIEKLLQRDFFLDKIVKIESEDYDGFVFDLFVPKTHNFVADGVFVHNCIDEFSEVSSQDKVALMEAMSLETISIAKASIVATLPAQTAILAGGNPKLGRFDPYIPIREQIDIDDALLSRFDLKFALRDLPNPEIDEKIAEHVLKMRQFEEEAKPLVEPEFLRKYIAYARAHIHPTLTKEAGERIKEFYLQMRAKSGEEAPIAITLRQYESLLRLAEASAKARLSQTIDLEDAERAIRLMKVSLRQFGFDPETRMLDIDRAEGQKVTAAQRGKIRIMRDILEELTRTYGKQIPTEEIIKKAKESGIEDAEEILKKMLNEGLCFSPKPGVIEKIG
jgi:replicative DNA helicase Mcm